MGARKASMGKIEENFYSKGIIDGIKIIKRTDYRGRGRPRKTDYVYGTSEAENIVFRMLNKRFKWMRYNLNPTDV